MLLVLSMVITHSDIFASVVAADPATARRSHSLLVGVTAVIVGHACAGYSASLVHANDVRPPTNRSPMFAHLDPTPVSPWVRSIQMSLFNVVFGTVLALAQADAASLSASTWPSVAPQTTGTGHLVRFFAGFQPVTWLAIILQASGGLLTGKRQPLVSKASFR